MPGKLDAGRPIRDGASRKASTSPSGAGWPMASATSMVKKSLASMKRSTVARLMWSASTWYGLLHPAADGRVGSGSLTRPAASPRSRAPGWTCSTPESPATPRSGRHHMQACNCALPGVRSGRPRPATVRERQRGSGRPGGGRDAGVPFEAPAAAWLHMNQYESSEEFRRPAGQTIACSGLRPEQEERRRTRSSVQICCRQGGRRRARVRSLRARRRT